jgi:hypothetical protein
MASNRSSLALLRGSGEVGRAAPHPMLSSAKPIAQTKGFKKWVCKFVSFYARYRVKFEIRISKAAPRIETN